MIAIFGGFFTVPLYTLIEQRAEPSERSRVIAAHNVMNALLMVAASILLALLFAQNLSVPHIFLIVAGLNAAVAVAAKKDRKRGLRFPLRLTIGDPIPAEAVTATALEERVRTLMAAPPPA